MKLTYTREQLEQVWRALGWEKDPTPITAGLGCVPTPNWIHHTSSQRVFCEHLLPKPEDVLWELRQLAIEKDEWGYHYALTHTLTESEQEDRDLYQKHLSCATPQQIFDAALAVIEGVTG